MIKDSVIAQLAARIEQLRSIDGMVETPIKGLFVCKGSTPKSRAPQVDDACIAIIAGGNKSVYVDEHSYCYSPGDVSLFFCPGTG